MELIKPKKLKKGDTIGFVSVSGYIKSQEELQKSKEHFENLGYKVKISDTSFSQDRYFCADDETRAKALNDFFADDEIKAVICTRGGYGAIKILDKIDYELIKKNPKIFSGYSDISAILWSIYQKTGLITYHGAHAVSTFQKDNFTQQSFWQNMADKLTLMQANSYKTYFSEIAKGAFIGGNLSTIVSMCGRCDFAPKEDFILFLEDLNEPVYKIDKMITQLFNTEGFLTHLKGIVLGEFTQIDNEDYLNDLWKDIANKLKIPMCDGFKISHKDEHLVTPYGVPVEFSSEEGIVRFL